MQIVNTKLPNENIQTYQPQIINSGVGGNYQMQIVSKLPNGTTNVAQNDLEQPILPNSQLFQSFPTEVAQNGQFHPIHNFANLFPPEWLRMTWNGQFCLISNFSNIFPPND